MAVEVGGVAGINKLCPISKMKTNLNKNILTDVIKLTVFLFLLFGGCRNIDVRKEIQDDSVLITEKKRVKDSELKNNGTYYSDSMIKVLSKLDESFEIDSFADLHSFDKAKFQFEYCDEFTLKMLVELDEYGIHNGVRKTVKYPKVTRPQYSLLGVTEYLCDKTYSDKFAMYIFHSSGIESHFSNSIQLYTISNITNKFNSLVLSQIYLSEGYEYDITSRFISNSEIELTKHERFNTSNISEKDDSTSYIKIKYLVDSNGDIVANN